LWLQANGQEDQAADMLARALRLAGSEGFIRLFADQGPSLAPLLRRAAGRSPVPANAKAILALLAAGQAPDITQPAVTSALMEPLVEQESRVLRLMAAGLSNRDIAAELFLSINTIKTYTSRIYGKLGVHNRAEAVARAHELGLL